MNAPSQPGEGRRHSRAWISRDWREILAGLQKFPAKPGRPQGLRSFDTRRAGSPVRAGWAVVYSPNAANATRMPVRPDRAHHCHSHSGPCKPRWGLAKFTPGARTLLENCLYTTHCWLCVKGKLPFEDAEMLHPRSRVAHGHATKRGRPQPTDVHGPSGSQQSDEERIYAADTYSQERNKTRGSGDPEALRNSSIRIPA